MDGSASIERVQCDNLKPAVTLRPPLSRLSSATNNHNKGIVVFSGGSAANNLVDVFEEIRLVNASTLSYVIPISDNGGSSSEVIRVFGGPGTFLVTRANVVAQRPHMGSINESLYLLKTMIRYW
jgi:hypothetical protein